MPFSWAPVTVLRRQPEAADRVALGVKLDEDRRLGPRDPRVVSGLDRDDLRRHDLECTAVPVPPLHATAGEEADVRVHAVLRADNGSDVRRPAEAWRVDDPLHPAVGRAHDVELDAADAHAGGSKSSALAGMAASESATANRPLRETTGHAITSRRSYLPGVTRSRARDAGCRVTRLGTTRRADGQGASTVPVDSGSGSRSERRHRRRRPERRARRPRSARRGLAS